MAEASEQTDDRKYLRVEKPSDAFELSYWGQLLNDMGLSQLVDIDIAI